MKDYKTTWQVHGIFPEPIYLSHLNRSFTKKELKSVESHKKGLIQNAGNKTSKNKYVLNKPEMSKLKKDLLKHVNLYLEKVIATEHKVTLNITQSWLNYTNENQYHHEHSHSNSFLSGVLYMKANSETDRIFFHKDMSKGTLRLKPKTFNLYIWKQTWEDGSQRKNFAGIGFTYDSSKDAFIPPQPYPSWILNDDTCEWDPPVPYPSDTPVDSDGNPANYKWDEDSQSWIVVPYPADPS